MDQQSKLAMKQNENGNTTPGGTQADDLVNPPSSEAGSRDSGGSQSLWKLEINTDTLTTTSSWIDKTKKRQRHSPDKISRKQHKPKQVKMDYWLNPSIATSNRYSSLESDEDSNSPLNEDQSANTTKQVKPPPIFVAGVGDINPLLWVLKEIAKNKYTLRIISHTDVKI